MRRIVTDAAIRRAVLAGEWNRMGTVEIFRRATDGGRYSAARGKIVAETLKLMGYTQVRQLVRNRASVENRVSLWFRTRAG